MMVYIDNAFIERGRRLYSHMMADSNKELHEFAARLGLKRCWFRRDHYDVSAMMRVRAIELGARPVSPEKLVAIRVERRRLQQKKTR